jgi:signal transduction histidine kinase
MIRLIFLLLLAFGQLPALAQDSSLLLEQAYLKDPRAELTIEQAGTSVFQPYQGNLGLGFQPGATWIRLKIDRTRSAHDEASRHVVLRFGPNFIQQIELHAQTQGHWRKQLGGALAPLASQLCPDDMHCFALETSASQETTAYLRLQHAGFLLAQIEVLSTEEVPFAVAKRVRAVMAAFLVALGLLGLGLAFLLIDRSYLFLAYCSFQFTVVLFIASNTGLIAKNFPTASPELLSAFNSFLYILRVAMTLLLTWAIVHPHQPSQRYALGVKWLLGLCVLNVVLVFSGQVQLALKSSLVIFCLLPFWVLYGIWSASHFPVQQRRVATAGVVFFILLFVVGLLFSFTDQIAMPSSGPIKQIVDIRLNGMAIGVVFFWLTMIERSSQKKTHEKEVQLLRHQALQAKTQRAELDERSALIDMLTHELKNPLSTVRFALSSLKQQALGHKDWLKRIQSIEISARRMDDLIERVAHFSKIERDTDAAIPVTIDPSALIQELLSDVDRPEQWDLYVEPGVSFRSDRQLLYVILENLMTNASKYTLNNQPIRIEVTHEKGLPPADAPAGTGLDSFTRFEISNFVDPASVPEEQRLFERYYRHPNASSQPGMGLGLSVVKSVAQRLGGKLAYRHERGQVFFTLRVPA